MPVPTLAPLPSRENRPDTLDDDVERLFQNIDAFGQEVEAAKNTAVAAAEAGASGYSFVYDSATAAADPTAGKLRFNGPVSTATAIYISTTTATASAIGALIDTFDDSTSPRKGTFRIVKSSDPSKFVVCALTAISNAGGSTWRTLTVVPIAASGGNPFATGDNLSVQYAANGDRGEKGEVGNADKRVAAVGAPAGSVHTIDYLQGGCQVWNPPPGACTLKIINWPAAGTLGELWLEGVNLGQCTITTEIALEYLKADGSYNTTTSMNANQGATLRNTGVDNVLIWGRNGAPQRAKVAR